MAAVAWLLWLLPSLFTYGGPAGADARVVGLAEARGLASAATVHVMGLGCGVLQAGSGTALADGSLVTNRHVVEDAGAVRVSRRQAMVLGDVEVGEGVDLAVVRAVVPAVGVPLAEWEPGPGAEVTVAGFPAGRPVTAVHATVVDYVDGAPLGQPGRLMRVDVPLAHGMSGGPVLDATGHVAGIVFATDEVSGYGLVIPVSTVRDALAGPARRLPPGC
jgi:S1-C subfamily serine protease